MGYVGDKNLRKLYGVHDTTALSKDFSSEDLISIVKIIYKRRE